jgi:hypothetical protein
MLLEAQSLILLQDWDSKGISLLVNFKFSNSFVLKPVILISKMSHRGKGGQKSAKKVSRII